MGRYLLRNNFITTSGEKHSVGETVELTGQDEAVALDFKAAIPLPELNVTEDPKAQETPKTEAKTVIPDNGGSNTPTAQTVKAETKADTKPEENAPAATDEPKPAPNLAK